MNEIEILTKKFLLVDMDTAKISTPDKPIIGTQALATCYGVLIYNEERKVAIVAHISSKDLISVINDIYTILTKEKLYNKSLKYKIIDGTYPENIEVKKDIERHFKNEKNFEEMNIPDTAIQTDERTQSNQFAFDTTTGTFITNKVMFGTDYLIINGDKYNNDITKEKHR